MSFLLDRDFDHAVFHLAAEQHRPHLFACALVAIGRVCRVDADVEAGRLRSQQIEQPFVDAALGLRLNALQFSFAHQADRVFDELADHALDVATVVTDFRVLCGLDFDERRAGQRREAAGDFSFSDAGRADHENVFGRDFIAHFAFEPLTAPTVANCDRDGALGIVLTDDVAIELGDDLSRR